MTAGPEATRSSSFHSTRVSALAEVARGQRKLVLLAPPALSGAYLSPGQHCVLRLSDGAQLALALTSRPREPFFTFLVNTTRPLGMRISWLRERDWVELSEPRGAGFDLASARGADLVFVATGTGIGPVRAALECVLDARADFGSLTLWHGVRTARYAAFREEHSRWIRAGVRVRVHPSRETQERSSHVQDQVFRREPIDLARTRFITAGHLDMVEALRREVRERGGDPKLVLSNV